MLFPSLPYAAPLLSLALLWTVAVVTPGPNFFNTAQLAASCSRRHGVVASAGVATGTVMWGLAGGLGIKSLFTAAPMLYLAFKIIGGCYLIYLGLKLFRRSAPAMAQNLLPDEPRRSLFSAWRLGLLGNLSNPKAALFVATIFASTMPPSPSPMLLTLAVITMATINNRVSNAMRWLSWARRWEFMDKPLRNLRRKNKRLIIVKQSFFND